MKWAETEIKKQEGCRKLRRPQLGWEDCVKRDMRKAEEKNWKEKWKPEEEQELLQICYL